MGESGLAGTSQPLPHQDPTGRLDEDGIHRWVAATPGGVVIGPGDEILMAKLPAKTSVTFAAQLDKGVAARG